LRDTQAISRQSYLEFDLEAMFDGEVFSDFVLLWLMAHATRFAAREDGRPESCWLEQWTKIAEEQGARALGDLQGGVERALQILGQGFVGHPKNAALRDALRTGQLTASDLHGQLLRIVYRLIFLFVAEDRTLDGVSLLHAPDNSDSARIARERYAIHYSAARLRELSGEIRGSRHGDLWWQFNLVVGALSVDGQFNQTREQLALPVLGSFLWSPDSTAALNAPTLAIFGGGTELANADFLEAIQNLAFTRQHRNLRPVDYKNLGAEELGGVYESLLSLTPQISGDGAKFTFAEFAGNERKTSGSYYTPDSLVQCLLDSALEPVIQEAVKGKIGTEAEKAILSLKICDPAVGSGHFLVGAAHRLARHVARIRAASRGEGEPSPGFHQHALRDVIGRCLYGVDINPMAAELCRVGLWLEALEPGKPLSFLDHHIRVGNSLLGTTSELIIRGLPDDAYDAIEGDDKDVCKQLKKRNRAERDGFQQEDWLNSVTKEVGADITAITYQARLLDEIPDDSADEIGRKADQFHRLVVSGEYTHAQQVSDTWCSSFVWPKTMTTLADVATTGTVRQLAINPGSLTARQRTEIARLSKQYQFFHWPLAFPEVFAKGGFDCLLGNPPWDMQEVKDNEFFAGSYPSMLSVKSAKDKEAILEQIQQEAPALWTAYVLYVRVIYGQQHLMACSGRFPLGSTGRINLYRLFLETGHTIIARWGRVGIVIPSGFVSDSFSQEHFTSLHGSGRLISVFDFENREGLFQGVDSRYRFSLVTIGQPRVAMETDFAFYAASVPELSERDRHVHLSQGDLARINPLTKTAPLFRNKRDYVLTDRLQSAGPIIGEEGATGKWQVRPLLMFMMNATMRGHRTAEEMVDDGYQLIANRFQKERSLWLPLLEGKMVGMYDHRAASIRFDPSNRVRRNQPVALSTTEHVDPEAVAIPMFWLNEEQVGARCNGIPLFCLVVKDVTSATNERTCIAAILPGVALTDSLPWLRAPHSASLMSCLLGNLNSYVFDFVARQKVAGLHLRGHYLAQLPIIDVPAYAEPCKWAANSVVLSAWLQARVLELTYAAWDLEPFAKDCGFKGPPFRWDEDRRALLRGELDAAFFHLCLPSDANGDWVKREPELDADITRLRESFAKPRDTVEYIMDSFPIVKKNDIEKYGDFRSKLQILDIYDEMQQAMKTGVEYKTKLDPPPADTRCCHSARDAPNAQILM
jgi:hypothetical protein